MSKSLSTALLSSLSFPSLYIQPRLPCPRQRIWHLSLLNFIWLMMVHLSNFLRSLCKVFLPLRESTAPPNSVTLSHLVSFDFWPHYFCPHQSSCSTASVWGVLQGQPLATFCFLRKCLSKQQWVCFVWWLLFLTTFQLTAKKDTDSKAT